MRKNKIRTALVGATAVAIITTIGTTVHHSSIDKNKIVKNINTKIVTSSFAKPGEGININGKTVYTVLPSDLKIDKNGSILGFSELFKTNFDKASYVNLEIPATTKNKTPITSIATSAFDSTKNPEPIKIYNVDLSKAINLTEIKNSAFKKANFIKKVTFNKELSKLGASAFLECESIIEYVGFENTKVSIIEPSTFSWNLSLEKINFPKSLTDIKGIAFYMCYFIETLDFSGTNLRTIGDQAFTSVSNLKHFYAPDSLTSIGSGAFELIKEKNTIGFNFPKALNKASVFNNASIGIIEGPNSVAWTDATLPHGNITLTFNKALFKADTANKFTSFDDFVKTFKKLSPIKKSKFIGKYVSISDFKYTNLLPIDYLRGFELLSVSKSLIIKPTVNSLFTPKLIDFNLTADDILLAEPTNNPTNSKNYKIAEMLIGTFGGILLLILSAALIYTVVQKRKRR